MNIDGNTLKAMRVSAGVTQAELAAYLGYFSKGEPNRSVISRMENGSQDINVRIQMLVKSFLDARESTNV
ncbi:MAG: helix-turn-helix domain-containing protein [Paracoccaceae bacterium]|tara:strand:+ start:841 stop:1050 length:210 start_codon:yes stop_codon:yes gene_type:complete